MCYFVCTSNENMGVEKTKDPHIMWIFYVVRPGFEPRQTVPKTVVLPLHHRTNRIDWGANVQRLFKSSKHFFEKV